MLLSIEALRYGFDGVSVIDGFDLSVDQSQHLLLLGPSGSGKSTLINLIAGLRVPEAGSIRFDGERIDTLSAAQRDAHRRHHIGIIFQTLRLVSALDVTANLLLAQRLADRPRDAAEVRQLLEAMGIAHRAHARPRDLSQGEAQRAAIARALIARPQLLIADEPTSALDEANMRRVAELLLASAEATGATLLIATHDARLREYFPRTVTLAAPSAKAA